VVGCTALRDVFCSEDNKVITPLGMWLWRTMRQGIQFTHIPQATQLWQDLIGIEREEVVIW
jgi:hypothetical protein